MFYIEIDIAKKKHEASIIDSFGKYLSKSISFPNTIKGIESFQDLLNSFNIDFNNGTAIGAVARKLTNIIFAVLRDNKEYVPNI